MKTYNDPRCDMSLAEIEAELASEFMAKYPTLDSFLDAHPVVQDTHLGGWGFERYLDGVDLRSCRYPNREYAEKARATAYGRADCRASPQT